MKRSGVVIGIGLFVIVAFLISFPILSNMNLIGEGARYRKVAKNIGVAIVSFSKKHADMLPEEGRWLQAVSDEYPGDWNDDKEFLTVGLKTSILFNSGLTAANFKSLIFETAVVAFPKATTGNGTIEEVEIVPIPTGQETVEGLCPGSGGLNICLTRKGFDVKPY